MNPTFIIDLDPWWSQWIRPGDIAIHAPDMREIEVVEVDKRLHRATVRYTGSQVTASAACGHADVIDNGTRISECRSCHQRMEFRDWKWRPA